MATAPQTLHGDDSTNLLDNNCEITINYAHCSTTLHTITFCHSQGTLHGDDSTNLLDNNHSHFLLVDNNEDGPDKFGCERALRAAFETCVAGTAEVYICIYKCIHIYTYI